MSRQRGRSRAGGEGPSPGGLIQPSSSEENLYKAVLRASEGKKGTREAGAATAPAASPAPRSHAAAGPGQPAASGPLEGPLPRLPLGGVLPSCPDPEEGAAEPPRCAAGPLPGARRGRETGRPGGGSGSGAAQRSRGARARACGRAEGLFPETCGPSWRGQSGGCRRKGSRPSRRSLRGLLRRGGPGRSSCPPPGEGAGPPAAATAKPGLGLPRRGLGGFGWLWQEAEA